MTECFTEGQKAIVIIGSTCGLFSFIAVIYVAIRVAIENYNESDYDREQRQRSCK